MKKTRGPKPRCPAKRFWRRWKEFPFHECWEWVGARDKRGYGNFSASRKRWVIAPRYSWFLTHGTIPDGLCVLHRCDNPGCVRPDHLFLGTHKDNSADMIAKNRQKRPQKAKNWKLNYEKAELFRRLYTDGTSIMDIAKKFGLSRGGVAKVISGERWKRSPVNHPHIGN